MSLKRLIGLAGTLCMGLSCAAGAADQPRPEGRGAVVLKSTWWETMLASREALVQQEAEAEKQAAAARKADPVLKAFQAQQFEMTPRDEPRKVCVRIAGLKKVCLGARGQQEAVFADPQLIGRDGKAWPMALAKIRQVGPNGFGRHYPKQGGELIVAGDRKFTTGLTLQDTEVSVDLDEQAEWLEMWVGLRRARKTGRRRSGSSVARLWSKRWRLLRRVRRSRRWLPRHFHRWPTCASSGPRPPSASGRPTGSPATCPSWPIVMRMRVRGSRSRPPKTWPNAARAWRT